MDANYLPASEVFQNTYYIFYSTNVLSTDIVNNDYSPIYNLINNLFLENYVEVSIENNNQIYTDNTNNFPTSVVSLFTAYTEVNDENNDVISDQAWIAVIGYQLDTNSDFFKIVKGDYGSSYNLKITQTTNYP